jgi:predicted RNA-binding protein (virulence factor B family)
MELGEINTLRIIRFRSNGCYLGELDSVPESEIDTLEFTDSEPLPGVLLPNRYVTDHMKLGDEVDVFLYTDSEDRRVATTERPKILLHEFAPLEVKSVTSVGAFMDWGLSKDLFVPYSEQARRLEKGEVHVVFLYLDAETDRLVGTTKVDHVIDNEEIQVEEKEQVKLLVYGETPIGYKVIINDENIGLLYRSELNQPVQIGDYKTGYIKKIRPDGKIDVSLDIQGVEIIEPSAQKLLQKIQLEKGFVPFTDKSDPDEIRDYFQMSKKTFKKAVGHLYKNRLIDIQPDGLYLIVEEID